MKIEDLDKVIEIRDTIKSLTHLDRALDGKDNYNNDIGICSNYKKNSNDSPNFTFVLGFGGGYHEANVFKSIREQLLPYLKDIVNNEITKANSELSDIINN